MGRKLTGPVVESVLTEGLSYLFRSMTIVNETTVSLMADAAGAGRRSGSRPFGRLLEVLRVLRRQPSAARSVEELGVCLQAVRALRAWADAYEAEVLAEASRRDAAREAGAVDTAGWLRTSTGVTRREALARTRTAEGLDGLPGVHAALAEGRITHGHAQALTQIAAPPGVDLDIDPTVDFPNTERTVALAAREQQDDLIRAAETMSVDEYRRFLRRWADRVGGDDGAQRALRQRRERRATTFDTDDGMRGLRAVLPPEQFALFENELRRLAEARWRAEHPDAGCDRPHWMCEIHHIVPWAEGGRTDLDNLTLLCSKHHHLHHANERRRPSPEPAPDLQPMRRAAPHRVTPTPRRAPKNGQAPGASCDSSNGRVNSGPPQRAPASPDGSPAADVPPRLRSP